MLQSTTNTQLACSAGYSSTAIYGDISNLAMQITEHIRIGLARLRARLAAARFRNALPQEGRAKITTDHETSALVKELEAQLTQHNQLAIFIRYEQSDDLPRSQVAFLADLAQMGWLVWIVDNSPSPLSTTWREASGCSLYWKRMNRGMCIGAYADAIALLEQVMECNSFLKPPTLALINNSFLPLLPPSANTILRDLFCNPLPPDHFRGLTEAREQAYHLQSYLLILGAQAWCSVASREFWQRCRNLRLREQVICEGEVALTGTLLAAGFTSEVMIPLSRLAAMMQTRMGIQDHYPVSPIEHNPYLVYWKELLQLTGILKKSVLNNASQSRTAAATLADFIHVADKAGLPGATEAIDRLVRH